MRRRSTFIPSRGVDYDPSQVKIDGRHLSFSGLNAAREERLTFALVELPTEIRNLLNDSHELHLRWVSEDAYQKSSPYLSTLTPGLHVHYTPSTLDIAGGERLCLLLKSMFPSSPRDEIQSLRCSTPNATFSRPDVLSDRFAHAASLQYHSTLPSLQGFVARMQKQYCESEVVCRHTVALLNIATYMDIDYDSISHALTLTAYWSRPPAVLMDPIGEWTTYDHWNMALDASPSDRNEFGLLRATESPSEPSEIQMEGLLAVVGEDTELKPTMFFFPSRHHSLSPHQAGKQKFTTSFDRPTGLHPTMRIVFPTRESLAEPSNKPSGSTCALHTYLTLPSVLFADEYAFPTSSPDPLFTEAHNIISLRSISGEKDLEAPDYTVKKWGSALLLELATPTSKSVGPTWDVTIPLHLRYLAPTSGGMQTTEIPWPIVFWACTAEEGTKFSVNPFDRVNLGYDGLFGPRTMFYHLNPLPQNGSRLMEKIDVPVLDTNVISYGMAEVGTALLVLGGFSWIAWKVLKEILWEVNWWAKQDAKGKEKKTQ